MKEFVEFLVKQFVNYPDQVAITESQDENFQILSLKVADEDMGMVIGREGKTINSLRNMVRAKAIKDNVMVRLVLEENPNNTGAENNAQN